MSKSKVRCAIYTRKSHDEGLDQDFNSLDAQRAAAEAYVQSQVHEGWTALAARYDDGGFSGGTMDRPALAQLLDDIKSGRVDCVVVYKVDRLSRSLLDFAHLIALFDQHKVGFCSVTQAFSTTTSTGRLTLNLLLSFAQFEREIIGERIRDKKLLTARQGKYIGGQPKLGLDIVDRRYVVNPDEAKLVQRIFRMAREGHSCRKIAVALNAEGSRRKAYTTKTGKHFGGAVWRGRNVYDILTDQKYLGKIEHKGVAYAGEHEAIVSAEQFEQVRHVLAQNRVYTHKHQVKRFALLRRLLRCGECGSAVQPAWTRNHGREYRYYTCSKRMKAGYRQCSLPSIPADEIESTVVDQLRGLFRQPEVIASTFREVATLSDTVPDIDAVARLGDLHARRKRVAQAIRALLKLGDTDNEFLQRELQSLNEQLKSLDLSIREFESKPKTDCDLDLVAKALKKLDPIWDALYPAERRRILELLVDEICVGPDSICVRLAAGGIGRIVAELSPIGDAGGRKRAE